MNVQERIDEAIQYMNYWVDTEAKRLGTHYRVLDFNEPRIKFPFNHFLGDSNFIDWEIDYSNRGWGSPDFIVSKNLELRYLWKGFKQMSLDQWKTKTK